MSENSGIYIVGRKLGHVLPVPARDKNVRRSDIAEMAWQMNAGIASIDTLEPEDVPWFLKPFIRSERLSAAVSAFQKRDEAKQFVCLSEDVGLTLMELLRHTTWKGRLHIVVHAGKGLRRRFMFRRYDSEQVASYIVFCKEQKRILVDEVGLDANKVHVLLCPIDTQFFAPSEVTKENKEDKKYVFSCGTENRDYETLQAAAKALAVNVKVQATGYFAYNGDQSALHPNYSISTVRIPFDDLKALYIHSELVVSSLNNVDYAAGVTSILEGMALGKAIIATRTKGMRDYTEIEGVLEVPPSDPEALRNAIQTLLNDPERCAKMGEINRNWVVEHCDVSAYSETLQGLIDQSS